MSNFYGLIFMMITLGLSSCTSLSTKHLEPHEILLRKNRIKITDKSELGKDELGILIRQKPNAAILLGLWQFKLQWANWRYDPDKNEERPAVILDTTLMHRSKQQLLIALQQQGHYQAKVDAEYKIIHHFGKPTQKAKVTYTISPGKVNLIDSLAFDIKDSTLLPYLPKIQEISGLYIGAPFKINALQNSRDQIASYLRTQGYYHFSDNYVRFKADTNNRNQNAAIVLQIRNPRNLNHHEKFKIKNIYIYTDYEENYSGKRDTIHYQNKLYFISKDSNYIRYPIIYRKIFFQQNKTYNVNDHNDTYRSLLGLQIYKNIKINYDYLNTNDSTQNFMNVNIYLTPNQSKSLGIEATATFREGFGGNSVLSLQKRNGFGRGEILELNLNAGFENLKSTVDDQRILGLNFGPQLRVRLPGFIFFSSLSENMHKGNIPKSGFTMRYNYQRRVDYTRHLSTASLDYEWNQGNRIKHEISPIDLSFSLISKGSIILDKLEEFSPSKKFRFDNHFNSGIKYRFIYNTQQNKQTRNPLYLITRVNLMGPSTLLTNTFDLISRDENNALALYGIRYGNFIRSDVDFRKYFTIYKEHKIALRSFTGAGLTFDQFSVIPFDQLYFVGGANSIRGWQQRTLGPGALFNPDNSVDRLGDVRLELNMEYRFPITKIFKSAVFVDVGNIWNLNNEMEETNFYFNSFHQQIAVASGLGLRLDFDFFLFRLDIGFPIKQAYDINTWSFNFNTANLNFGIGYPF